MNQKSENGLPKDYLLLTPFFLFFILLTWATSDNIFFWDTIQLGAKHAIFYYENNFSEILLPDSFDSGHIPAFGMYLALCWKLFGKSLLVSHFSMLPFLLGIVWQSYLLVKKYISRKYLFLALIIFLADPTLLGQAILISPDIPLVFLFLMGLNSVLRNNNLLLILSITGLFLVSMRGMMVAFAIFLLDIIFNIQFSGIKKVVIQLLKKSRVYLPGFIIFLAFSIYHYKMKGWIGYHDDSPWSESFVKVELMGILYNLGIFAWRLWDFGRIILWIVFLFIVVSQFRKLKLDKTFHQLLIILLVVGVSLSISFILYKYLSGHRYILPVYLAFSLLTPYLVFEKLKSKKTRYFMFSLMLVALLSGNFWIYPSRIAQGWDASLAHLPYYKLRDNMMNYMEENGIELEDVGSAFPNNMKQKYIQLNDSDKKHCELNLEKNQYILYSNVYNDFSDEQVDQMENNFILEKGMKKRGVFIRLYRRPDSDGN